MWRNKQACRAVHTPTPTVCSEGGAERSGEGGDKPCAARGDEGLVQRPKEKRGGEDEGEAPPFSELNIG